MIDERKDDNVRIKFSIRRSFLPKRYLAPNGRTKMSSVPDEHSLNDKSVSGFELTCGGLSTFVYTASSPITVVCHTALRSACLAAKGKPHLLRHRAAHLSTPWIRLIDAATVAAFSLNFALPILAGFALYGSVSTHVEQQFVTTVIQ